MGSKSPVRRAALGAGGAAIAGVLLLLAWGGRGGASPGQASSRALIGEARRASVTVPIAPVVANVAVSEAKAPGRPIVLIDPGHGGDDPGATSVSGEVAEKSLTLALAQELRERLVERGRVRVALTRDSDQYLALEQRAAIARQLGAALFVSLHMDSAPNPLARGASVYSLADVASDAESGRFANAQNRSGSIAAGAGGSVGAVLADLALRSQMNASADLAARAVRRSAGRLSLRPEPHRFAAFHVLRAVQSPAILFEAGYISNAEDEALLRSPEHRARIVAALAEAIESDIAARSRR